jgi:hypothetical protein
MLGKISMSWIRFRLMPGVLVAVACVTASTACGQRVTAPGASATSVGQPVGSVGLRAPWPERRILPERGYIASQVFDPAADVLYALVQRTPTQVGGPYVLQATNLRTGVVRRGESYPVTGLSLASGYLWVDGWPAAGTPPVLREVSPGTLRTVRSVSIPSARWATVVTAGPAGSVWAGSYRTLLRVSVGRGTVLARTALPAGLGVDEMAVSPDGAYLYVSAVHVLEHGAEEGAAILGYSARTGELLAQTDRAPISYSVAGAELTAVPGGVWVSFRTGNLGLSVLLSERALSTVVAPTPGGSPTSIYYWPMFSSSVYGGGALWVATQTGLVACVNPATGRVRAAETVTSAAAQLGGLLVADGAAREVFGFVANDGYGGLVSIGPPRVCWG